MMLRLASSTSSKVLRHAKKLHNGDEVEIKMDHGTWVVGWVVGSVTVEEKLAMVDIQVHEGEFLQNVNHLRIR